MKKLLALSLLGCAASAYASSYIITGTQASLAGANTAVTDGTTTDFGVGADAGFLNNFAVFDLSNSVTNAAFGQLKVTVSGKTNIIGNQVFISRTSNSQGVTDTGTLTVLIQSDNVGPGSAELNFEFFAPGSYSGRTPTGLFAPITAAVNFTTFDIDFRQTVSIQRGPLASYQVASPTQLSINDDIPGNTVTFFDAIPTDVTFTEPSAAFSFKTATVASVAVEVGRTNTIQAYSLFIFELRDPSTIITNFGPPVLIPEPSVFASLVGCVALVAATRRRRVKA